MAMKQLCKLRNAAFHRQQGRCYYCDQPMWLDSSEEFMAQYGFTRREALCLQCTTEHCVPKRAGGRDDVRNIVAACWRCDNRRERGRAKDLPSADFRVQVRRRVARGRWHERSVLAKIATEVRAPSPNYDSVPELA